MKKIIPAVAIAFIVLASGLLFTGCSVGGLFSKDIKSIEIVASPTKLVYEVGNKFEVKGMKIKVVYDDDDLTEKTLDVKSSWVSGTALDNDQKFILEGDVITLKVTYKDKIVTFNVKVTPASET